MHEQSGENRKQKFSFLIFDDYFSELIRRTGKKSFTELLHLASIDRQDKTSVQHAPFISDFSKKFQ